MDIKNQHMKGRVAMRNCIFSFYIPNDPKMVNNTVLYICQKHGLEEKERTLTPPYFDQKERGIFVWVTVKFCVLEEGEKGSEIEMDDKFVHSGSVRLFDSYMEKVKK